MSSYEINMKKNDLSTSPSSPNSFPTSNENSRMKKKRSKIGAKIDDMINCDENTLKEVLEIPEKIIESNNENDLNYQCISISVHILLNFDKDVEDKIITVELVVREDKKISEVISETINEFNKLNYEFMVHNKKKSILTLDNNYKKYSLKASKKNFYPKEDYPQYNYNITLQDVGNRNNFSLCINDKNCLNFKETQSSCKENCLIF